MASQRIVDFGDWLCSAEANRRLNVPGMVYILFRDSKDKFGITAAGIHLNTMVDVADKLTGELDVRVVLCHCDGTLYFTRDFNTPITNLEEQW